ncbi:MAG: hypothetical protein GF317_05020 [Candidatus Lokiarchaeota archaeon]|nr:hypothetical protein [Candidatus Lokiarchaeota archaeon]MBD3199167.1 hypothetical protein [Candidatus Lokiarchaeota archaeon]
MASEEQLELFMAESIGIFNEIEVQITNFEENPDQLKPIEDLFFLFDGLTRLLEMIELTSAPKFSKYLVNTLEEVKDTKVEERKINQFLDILFNGLEHLRSIYNHLKEGDLIDLEDNILKDFKAKIEDFGREYDITFIQPIAPEHFDSVVAKKNYFQILIKIAESCKFKKVRLFFIFRALNGIGRICYSKPEPKYLEKGEFEKEFEIFFLTKVDEKSIDDVLEEILEIESKFIKKMSLQDFKREVLQFGEKWKEQKIKETEEISEKQEIKEQTLDEFINTITTEEIGEIKKDRSNIFYKIYIRINLTCKFKKLRTFLVFRTLSNLGRICWSNPNPDLLQKGQYNLDFEIYFISKNNKRVVGNQLDEILDIANKAINEINPKDFENIISKLSEKPKQTLKKKTQKTEAEIPTIQQVPKTSPQDQNKSPMSDEIKMEEKITLIYTNRLEKFNDKILLSNFHFEKLLSVIHPNLLFYTDTDETSKNYYLYLIKDGVILATAADEYHYFKEKFDIYEGGFTSLSNYLDAKKYEINDSVEYLSFKGSDYYAKEIESYFKFLENKEE